MTRDYWGEPSGEPRPDYRDAVDPIEPIEYEGKPARGERAERNSNEWDEAWGSPVLDETAPVADVPDLLGALRQSIERARALRQRCESTTGYGDYDRKVRCDRPSGHEGRHASPQTGPHRYTWGDR